MNLKTPVQPQMGSAAKPQPKELKELNGLNEVKRCCALLLMLSASVAWLRADDIFIRANQAGYRPQDAKIAIAFGKSALPDWFAVVAADTEIAVFAGKARPVTGVSWGGFENHVELDFTPLKRPGRYALQVGDSKSLPFTVGAGVYGELPGQLLEFMREQRCGYNPWLDAVCHPFDGRTAYGPLTNGTYLDARGGWHDAADLLKYLLTSGNATAQMLLAYELGQSKSKALRREIRGVAVERRPCERPGPAVSERHSRPARRSALGAGLDAQAAPRARPALSSGGGRPRPHGPAPAAE